MTRAQLNAEVIRLILDGGRRTQAVYVRELLTEIIDYIDDALLTVKSFTLWSSVTAYVAGDTVYNAGLIWYATGTNTNEVPGAGANWSLLVTNTSAYNATGWNGSVMAPTQDAVRDKFEALGTIYLPLAGGIMGGDIDMNSFDLKKADLITDASSVVSLSITDRFAKDAANVFSFSWELRRLLGTTAATSIDWGTRLLYRTAGPSLDYETSYLYDNTSVNVSYKWADRIFNDSSGVEILRHDTDIKIAKDVQITDATKSYYLGSSTTDGSWRILISAGDLITQKRIAGVWTTSSIYLPLAGGTMSGAIDMGGNDINNGNSITAKSSTQTSTDTNNKVVQNKILKVDTTGATPEELTTDGAAGSGSTNRISVPLNTSMSVVVNICVKQSGSANSKQMLRQFIIVNDAGTTKIEGAVTLLGTDVGSVALTAVAVTITANNIQDCIKVEGTGLAATNLRWTACLVSTEVLYA